MAKEMRYKSGDWWMDCDECGFTYRRSQMAKRWDGFWVGRICCWEPRHPQDRVLRVRTDVSVPVVRRNETPGDTQTASNIPSYISTKNCVAGYMIAGQAVAGWPRI